MGQVSDDFGKVSDDFSALRARLSRAIAGEALPCAVCDLDAFDANAKLLFAASRAANKPLRIASKSVRSIEVLDRIARLGGERFGGLMTFAAQETLLLARHGFRDLLLAYPTLLPRDCAALAEANTIPGVRAAIAVDAREQIEALSRAGEAAGARIPLVIDVDASWRPLGDTIHLGVRRSPLRETDAVVRLAREIAQRKGVSFLGLQSYEAQVAGLPDRGSGAAKELAVRAIKSRSMDALARSRRALALALAKENLAPQLFNGGGTGSLAQSGRDPSLTELTAGSGFFAPHLFAERYLELPLRPALSFALQATRRPSLDLITCAGGGIIASGEAGPSRLPQPWLPPGLSLLSLEGAGEVQTPLRIPRGMKLELGEPIFFRPAKAGEPLERFNELLLIRGDAIEARAKTYRGLGHAF